MPGPFDRTGRHIDTEHTRKMPGKPAGVGSVTAPNVDYGKGGVEVGQEFISVLGTLKLGTGVPEHISGAPGGTNSAPVTFPSRVWVLWCPRS